MVAMNAASRYEYASVREQCIPFGCRLRSLQHSRPTVAEPPHPQRLGRHGTTTTLQTFSFVAAANDVSVPVCVSVSACVNFVSGCYVSGMR